ncbi:hypothetical protein OKW21_003274 [Catalinimonas alkaloidigena]|uniref:hypothetical protein n=1 Tax=Catalinimonas alkaloidigena TaxID=1075417 RepID=UPI0024051F96|nr:hypothetical protein [Catalinimonas alkaloidigena]MDF9798011.1 hypothetical protein [Catalinimonas alkaloidigena]
MNKLIPFHLIEIIDFDHINIFIQYFFQQFNDGVTGNGCHSLHHAGAGRDR